MVRSTRGASYTPTLAAEPLSLAALRDFHGAVIQTTLDSEAEEALRQALG